MISSWATGNIKLSIKTDVIRKPEIKYSNKYVTNVMGNYEKFENPQIVNLRGGIREM